MLVSRLMWPLPRAPISETRNAVSRSTAQAVRGTPISLLNEPIGDTVGPSSSSTWARRSLVLVLPEDPVRSMAIMPRDRSWETTEAASLASPCWGSGTMTCGRSASVTCSARTAAAPERAAASAKSCPSTRWPRKATKRLPGHAFRLSMTTSGPTSRLGSPTSCPPMSRATCSTVVVLMRHLQNVRRSSGGPTVLRQRFDRRKVGFPHRPADPSHGPCRAGRRDHVGWRAPGHVGWPHDAIRR